MGVCYDIITKDNMKICKSDICFGAMNCFPWRDGSLNETIRQNTRETNNRVGSVTTADMKILQYLPANNFKWQYWSHPDGLPTRDFVRLEGYETPEDGRKRALKAYFKAMQEIVEDMPILKDCVTVHPILSLTRTHIKNFAADKVILSMFLMRNLAQYDYIHTYLFLRNQGYRPRVAAIFSQVFRYQKGNAISPSVIEVYSQSESSWIRASLFGRNAAIRLLRQEDESFWTQDPWVQQSCGYKRDSHLRREERMFDSSLSSGLRYRTLNSAACIPGDVSMPWKGDSEPSTEQGFRTYMASGTEAELISCIDQLIEAAGISR